MTRGLAAGLALALLAAPALAQDPEADAADDAPRLAPPGMSRVEVAPREVTVGDRVEATVTLVWDGEAPTGEPRFPAFQEAWGDAEVLGVGPVEAFAEGGRRVWRQTATLAAFRPGPVELPPLALAVPVGETTVTVETPGDVAFTVTSVLPAGEDAEEPEPRPAAPPVEVAGSRAFLVATAVLALGVLALATWLVRRLARTSPAVAALLRLDPTSEVLRALEAIDPTSGEAAHTRLSHALRVYLGRRLGFRAVEATTSEVQRRLRKTAAGDATGRRLVDLLRECDHVKFARREVDPATTRARVEHARILVDDVERSLAPPPEPAAGAAGPRREAAA